MRVGWKVPQLSEKPTTHKVLNSINVQFLHKRHPFLPNSNNEHKVKLVLKMNFLKIYSLGTVNLKSKKKEYIWKRI